MAHETLIEELSEAIYARLLVLEIDDVCHEVVGEGHALIDQLVIDTFQEILQEIIREELREFVIDECTPIIFEKLNAQVIDSNKLFLKLTHKSQLTFI